jgi:hypothetical protein
LSPFGYLLEFAAALKHVRIICLGERESGAGVAPFGSAARASRLLTNDDGYCTNVRIGSPAYVAAGAVRAAIDVSAGVLTGKPEYSWGANSSATEQELVESACSNRIERGEEPWPQ